MKWLAPAVLAAAAPAVANDGPRFCPSRPDLDAGTCTVEPRHVLVELSAADWQRDDTGEQREDRITAGDLLVRIGLGASTEAQLGWTPFGHVRTRDALTGRVRSVAGTGDVIVALRQNLRHPDGKGFSVAVQPYVTIPTGRTPVGDGDWSTGVLLPLNYDLGSKLSMEFTGEVDAAADESGRGRHGAYSGVAGLDLALTDALDVIGELALAHNDDPADRHTEALVAGSLAWQPTKRTQLDLLATAGLNRDTPDFRLVTGGAILF